MFDSGGEWGHARFDFIEFQNSLSRLTGSDAEQSSRKSCEELLKKNSKSWAKGVPPLVGAFRFHRGMLHASAFPHNSCCAVAQNSFGSPPSSK